MPLVENINTVLKFLEFIGIKGYEAKAYLKLIEIGESDAPRIASKAGIPLPRIYDVLESLILKGLIEVKAGRPRKYRALPPDIALNRYVSKYIEEINSTNMKVIGILSSLYKSKQVKTGPMIWITHSLEISIERMRSLIRNMKTSGFVSCNKEIFDRLANTLIKTFKWKKDVLFGVAVIAKPDEMRNYDKFLEIDNIEIRVLPTGILNLFETDLSNIVILGEGYSIYSNEMELVRIVNEAYYFAYWRKGKKIKEFGVKPGLRIKSSHHWLVLDLVEEALKSNLKVRAKIIGYTVGEFKPIELSGFITKVKRTSDDSIRTLFIDVDGKVVSVGGLSSSVEDVEARYLEIELI